jgi:hypothetical protein
MTSPFKKFAIMVVVLAIGAACSAEVLLNDTFADGDRTGTALPDESAVWFSHPANLTMGTGSLAVNQLAIGANSSKMWTYFAPNGSPVSLAVGDQLVVTVDFTPRGAMYSTTSKNFRFGVFNDPTDDQLAADTNSDNGSGRWYDSRGYAVMFTLSPDTTAGAIQVGKRTNVTGTANLLSTTGDYTWSGSSGQAANLVLNTKYTLKLTLDYQAADQMQVTFAFLQGDTVIATNSLTDNGLGSLPIFTNFDQLFFRMSSYSGTADILDYSCIKIEHISAGYEGPPTGSSSVIWANQSGRTALATPDTNVHDNNKLSVRSDATAAKSWIKFDLGDLDVSNLRAASLTVTLLEGKGGSTTVDVSAVNDDYTENIGWIDTYLTWNNAPANNTASQTAMDASKSTPVGTLSFVDGVAGQPLSINVLSILQADTDGIVQFALHNSSGLVNFTTHDHVANPSWRPYLTVIEPPLGADWPIPYSGKTVTTSLASLQWTNPEPNLPGGVITCDVYFGKDPNRPQMDKKPLGAGVEYVAINATNFPRFAPLADKTTYYWLVDCHDTTRDGVIEGLMWTFNTENNQAPTNVKAGADQVTWLVSGAASVNLSGSASDDGLPNPPAMLTYLWERIAGPASAVINTPNAAATSVSFTEAGDYTFRLTASDSEKQTSDMVRVVVGSNACDASHVFSGSAYDPGDFNKDCMVDMLDFAELISKNWLICTDTLTNCP